MSLSVASDGVLESKSEVGSISLQRLLHPHGLSLALAELHLHPQDLVLLLLKGGLSLLQGRLELHLLSLETLADFVNLVDGAAALSDLVHDVLDLIGEGLVLPPDLLQLEDGLLIGGLHLEQLRGGISGLLLAHIEVEGKAINLTLHLIDGLVELLGLPLHGGVHHLSLVEVGGHLVDLNLDLALGLLNLGQLGLEIVNGSLSLSVPGGELHLGHLQFLGLGHGLLLVLLSHGGGVTLGLGIQSQDVLTASNLLIKSLLGSIKLVFEVPVFSQEKLPLSGLIVAKSLHVIELSGKSRLGLGQHVQVVLEVTNDSEQLAILIGNLVLGHSEVSKCEVGSIDLLVGSVELIHQSLVGLVSGGLASHHLVSGGPGISDLSHDHLLVLLDLGLHLAQGIDLLLHLESGIALLPLQVSEDGSIGNVGLLDILAELHNLGLALLVELDLGNGGTAGLVVSLTKLLDLSGEVRPLPLGLGTSLALSLQLLLGRLNAGLQLLDVLLGLGHQGLPVIELGREQLSVLFLVGNHVLNLSPLSLKICNSVLCHLQISLGLPLLLLNGSPALLLLLQASLQLIQGGLQLRLHLAEMTDLLLSGDKVLGRLGLGGGQMLLLLVELVYDLVLLGDLILQGFDGVVPVALLLLDLGDGKLHILNVLLDSADAAGVSLHVSSQSNSRVLLSLEDLNLTGELGLGGGLDGESLGLPVSVDRDAALLLGQLLGHGGDLVLQSSHVALQLGSLVQSSLVLAVGGVGLFLQEPQLLLGVGQTNQTSGLLDDDEPSPVSHLQVLPEVPLGDLDQLPLISLLSINSSSDSLEDLSLDHSDPLEDEVITSLLKTSQSSGSEEDEGVSQPVPVTGEVDLVHQGVGGGLVVAGAGDLSLSQTSVSHLVVGVEHPVWESTHADPDTLQHTVTGQLVHDQWGLNLSGLLVSVGHKATDEVRLAVVEGGHQLSQRDQVDGGDSLTAATLLLLLALLLGSGGGLAGVVSPQPDQQLALGGGLEHLDNSVFHSFLLLLKPASHVVV